MKKTVLFTAFALLLIGCKTWDYGDTHTYIIPEGKHTTLSSPTLIEGTEVWGGEMTVLFNTEQMIDKEYNFSYWNKLGGLMPDLNDNFIPGKHQSARAAWRIDPPDMDYIYLGYIIYVWGQEESQRGYLLSADGTKIKVPVGSPFNICVKQYDNWWGITAHYGGQEAYIKVEEPKLRKERFLVVMDPYYGGVPAAPTAITITLRVMDTTWIYD